MKGGGWPGLAGVSLADLEALHELIERERLRCPVTAIRLAAVGLGHLEEALSRVRDWPREQVLVVLEVALSERRSRVAPILDLVWTGPETVRSGTRSTAVVVREMFARARDSVVIAGYSFDHAEQILAPLHAVMRDHGVTTRIFIHVPQDRLRVAKDPSKILAQLLAERAVMLWPFGDPRPELFHDPRALSMDEYLSLHAKCVVVDEREVLLTSANFTDRAQHRNVELGVHVIDAEFARRVAGHWHSLVSAGLMVTNS